MKKVGIITLIDNNNYGNRLQNYAVQEILKKQDLEVETILNRIDLKGKKLFKVKNKFRKLVKKIINKVENIIYSKNIKERRKNFLEFNKENIKNTENYISTNNIPESLNYQYDYFVTGSDQVWNPNLKRLTKLELLGFADPHKRISFAASFAVNQISEENKKTLENYLNNFKAISVREEMGKKIIEDTIDRKDVKVIVDPTMLLKKEEWEQVMKEPKNCPKKYILNYFLGKLPKSYKKSIDKIAKENNCEIINILDKKSRFYSSGPAEFLYLEKNAFLVCTDSFHSSVFAILFNRPFCIFERKEKIESMNSRLDTLLKKFDLEDRRYNGNIPEECFQDKEEQISHYLEKERNFANDFIKEAIN